MLAENKDSQAEQAQPEALPKAATLPDAVKIPAQDIQQLEAVQSEADSRPPETTSCISSGMTVIGKIVVDGSVMVYGHVEGELQASDVVICEGAEVAGNIIARELTVEGGVRGTIHAVHVKLHNTAVVEGDIFHRRLAIEENARFEGTSRRENNLADRSASVQEKVLDS